MKRLALLAALALGGCNSVYDPGTNLMFTRYYRYPKFQNRVQADHAMDRLVYTYYSATTMHSFGVPYC